MKRYETIYTKGKKVYKKIINKMNYVTACYYVIDTIKPIELISITLLPSEEG